MKKRILCTLLAMSMVYSMAGCAASSDSTTADSSADFSSTASTSNTAAQTSYSGTVTAISSSSITVSTDSGDSETAAINDSTAITRGGPGGMGRDSSAPQMPGGDSSSDNGGTPQEKPEPAPEPKAPQADVTEEARIEARQILMEARLKADAAEERLKRQAEEQQGRMTEHARDLAASLAMLRERVTRVDERLSAATADLDDATTAIYQALDATGADFAAFGAELRHFGENTAKENYPAAQAKVRHNKSAQPAAKRVRPVRSQPQVQANNANTHRLRRAGDTRRSVSQDLNAELERLNQPAAVRK